MIENLAMNWHHAETNSIPPWVGLTEARKQEIRDRVYDILRGEVRRSECGPGDLVVWQGRFRSEPSATEMVRRAYDDDAMKTRDVCKDRRAFYDSMPLDQDAFQNTWLFGNTNIGNMHRSNLQVSGQLACDEVFYVTSWHVSLSEIEPATAAALERLFGNSTSQFMVGDRTQATARLVELFREPQRVDLVIPVRQNCAASVLLEGLPAWKAELAAMRRDPERDAIRLFVHVEGWRMFKRSGR